jgi:hypothetical protein
MNPHATDAERGLRSLVGRAGAVFGLEVIEQVIVGFQGDAAPGELLLMMKGRLGAGSNREASFFFRPAMGEISSMRRHGTNIQPIPRIRYG